MLAHEWNYRIILFIYKFLHQISKIECVFDIVLFQSIFNVCYGRVTLFFLALILHKVLILDGTCLFLTKNRESHLFLNNLGALRLAIRKLALKGTVA